MGTYGAGSLTAAGSVRRVAGGGCESASAIGRGTSTASGAWPRRVSGSVGMRRADFLRGLAGTAHRWTPVRLFEA